MCCHTSGDDKPSVENDALFLHENFHSTANDEHESIKWPSYEKLLEQEQEIAVFAPNYLNFIIILIEIKQFLVWHHICKISITNFIATINSFFLTVKRNICCRLNSTNYQKGRVTIGEGEVLNEGKAGYEIR